MRKARLKLVTRMSHAEYRANLNGLNIFFGAVLGFVLAGSEKLSPLQFAGLLFFTAGVVINILYVNSSRLRVIYTALGAVVIAILPAALEAVLGSKGVTPPKLQPTLGVWLAMTFLAEFLPREPAPEAARADEEA